MTIKPELLVAEPVTQESTASGFIKDYVKYADIFEAPPEAHEAVAITAISAAANKNVTIKNGGQTITLDKWTLLLSGSGVGRNTLVSMLWPVLEAAGLEGLTRNATWGSKQGFYQDLAENPNGLFVWEEVSAALKALSDSRFGEAKQWLTNCYDNLRRPADIKYRTRTDNQNTPPIVFSESPRLNILATSSHDWFMECLTQEDSAGGFIPRWFLIDLPVIDRSIPTPNEPNNLAIPNLAQCLLEVQKLKGTIDLSKIKDQYAEWYQQTKRRFADQPNQALAAAFWNRHRVHLLKLAAIHGMSLGNGLSVSCEAMQQAIKSAKKAEDTIFKLLPTGMNHEGAAIDKLEAAIFQAGEKGLLKSSFTRAFQSMRTFDRESRLRTLIEARQVIQCPHSTAGRPAEVLVHESYVEKHRKICPNDVSQPLEV